MFLDGRLYTGHLKRATRRLGVHTHLKSVYWRLNVPRLLFKVSRQSFIVHEIGDVDVELPLETYWQYQRFRWMHPEIRLFEDLVDELESGDVFYDVGAHLGWHSIVGASVHDEVDVVAFEPHPITADRLRTVAEMTGHDINIREVALHEESGTVEFTAEPSSAAHVSGVQGEILSDTITVETIDGDSLVVYGELAPPDVLKIDAEGVDAQVLRGLRETIEQNPPRVIYCEVHADGADIEMLLGELGY